MLLTPVITQKSTLPTDDELSLSVQPIENVSKYESRVSHTPPSSRTVGSAIETKTYPNVSGTLTSSVPITSSTVLSSWLQGSPMKKTSSSVFGAGSSETCVLPSVAELQQSLRSNTGLNILGLLNSNIGKFQLNSQGTLIDYPVLPKVPSLTPNANEKATLFPKASSTQVITNLPVAKVKLPFIAPKRTTANLNSQPNALVNDVSFCNSISESNEKSSHSSPSVEKFLHVTPQPLVNTTTSQTSASSLYFVARPNCLTDDLSSVVLSNGIANSHGAAKNSAVQNWGDVGSLSVSLSEGFNKNWIGENQELNPCQNVDMLSALTSSSCPLPEFPENLFNQCVEEIHCYKCKFCSVVYISLSKEDAISHLTTTHAKELDILQGPSMATVDSTSTEWLSSSLLAPNFRTNFSLAVEDNGVSCLANSGIDAPPSIVNVDGSVIPQEASFICGKCQKTFLSLQECQEHLSLVHQVKSSRIRECKNHLEMGRPESQHRIAEKTMSSLNKTPGCQMSKKHVAISAKSLNSHNGLPNKRKAPKLRIISKKKLKREQGCYICEFKGCNVRFRLLDNLQYHYTCHVNGSSMFACPECSTASAPRWSSMAGHLWRQHVIDLELHACDQCSFRTYSLSLLENLHKRTHGEERPYLCDTCGKSFKTSKQLRGHKGMHQRGGRTNGECHICHRRFGDKRMQRIHLEMVHKKMKPFLCNFCGYAASSRSTLRMHMRQHTGEKPFSCDLCDYCTSDHNSLRRHKMRHSGEKPYKCPYCKYACIQSSTYKGHLKNKHPGRDKGLMFSCSICCFNTIKKDTYMTHMADHKLSAVLTNTEPDPQEEMDGQQYLSLAEAVQISLSQSSSSVCNTTSNRALLSALEDNNFQKVDDLIHVMS